MSLHEFVDACLEMQRVLQMTRLADVEAWQIERMLDACKGNKVQAAKALGIDRTTLYQKLHELGIQPSTAKTIARKGFRRQRP